MDLTCTPLARVTDWWLQTHRPRTDLSPDSMELGHQISVGLFEYVKLEGGFVDPERLVMVAGVALSIMERTLALIPISPENATWNPDVN